MNLAPIPETSIVQTVIYRDASNHMVEKDIPVGADGNPVLFAAGTFHASMTAMVNTPDGQQMPLGIRVHLKGAEDLQHAFDNFDALVRANTQEAVNREIQRREAQARRMMLAQGGAVDLGKLKGRDHG